MLMIHPKTATYIETLKSTIAEQQEQITALNEKLNRMNELLLNAQRACFAQSSEKRDLMRQSTFNKARRTQCTRSTVSYSSKLVPFFVNSLKVFNKKVGDVWRACRRSAAKNCSKIVQSFKHGLKICTKKACEAWQSSCAYSRRTVQNIVYGLKTCATNTSLFIRRAANKLMKLLKIIEYHLIMCGKNVHFSWRLSLEKHISIRTHGKGKITFSGYAAIRSHCELHADGGEIHVGDQCFINRNCMIVSQSKIEIGDNTTIGPNVVIYDHDHDYVAGSGTVCSDVKIGKNVWIGANATILRGSVIGDNCVIGAGTLVKGIIDENTMVYAVNELKQIDLLSKRIL